MENFILFHSSRYFEVHYNAETKMAVCTALKNFIPEQQFKDTFNKIGELVKQEHIEKLVFDKTKLTVFHQKSMTWYHVEWKEEMLKLGLKEHFKILPKDKMFRESVKIGKAKISKDYPNFDFNKFNIKYIERLEDAL